MMTLSVISRNISWGKGIRKSLTLGVKNMLANDQGCLIVYRKNSPAYMACVLAPHCPGNVISTGPILHQADLISGKPREDITTYYKRKIRMDTTED